MQQRDVAEAVEPQQLVLRQALLRHRARRTSRRQSRRRRRRSEGFAAGDHERPCLSLRGGKAGQRRQCASAGCPARSVLRPGVHRRQIELQIAVFLGVRRQLVGADVDLAPLEALADVPDRLQAGAPGREMIVLALLLAEPLAADPLQAAACGAVAIDAGEVELAELALGSAPCRARTLPWRRGSSMSTLIGSPLARKLQIDRHRDVLVALHQPVRAGRRLGVASRRTPRRRAPCRAAAPTSASPPPRS